MRYLLFIIFILLFQISLNAQLSVSDLKEIDEVMYVIKTSEPYTGSFVEYFPEGPKGREGKYVNGKMEGTWIWWYKDGTKKRESDYINNKKNGKTIYWYKDGTLQAETNYKNDLFEGKSTWYHPNGQKKKIAVYKNGLFLGSVVWDENGNILENNIPKEEN